MASKKLILIAFCYLVLSLGLSVLAHVYQDSYWFRRHVQWTYLVWSFRGPVAAAEYGWHGLAPIWQHLQVFLAGGPVILPFLSLPIWFKGLVSARLRWLGLILWLTLAASLFGTADVETGIDRLIAVAADSP